MDMLFGIAIGVLIGWLIRRIHWSAPSPQSVKAIVEMPPTQHEPAEAERQVQGMRRKLLKASSALYTGSS